MIIKIGILQISSSLLSTTHFQASVSWPRTYHLPIDDFEERMIDNIHERGLTMAAQTISGILVEETFENGSSLNAQ